MADKYQPYPEYKKSEVEWLREIPALWLSLSLGKAVEFMNNGSAATQIEESTETVKVTRIESISAGVINLDKIGHVRRHDILSRFLLKAGDIQFSNINSLSMVGNCALFDADQELFSGMNLLHIRPDISRVYAKYMVYQFKTKWFRNRVEASAKPAINQASIPTGTLKHFDFLCPPLEEQQKIASFLDHETAKIDTLIDKQQQLITLLKEKRQAVISHAVTKGLNPKAPMRDSGIEWLGEVPEHWERKSLNYLIAHTVDNRGRTPPIVEEGIPMVEVSQIAGNGFYTSDNYSKFITQESYDQYVRSDVKENDILFVTVGATFGKTCLVPYSPGFFIAQNVVGFRCIDDVDSKFFMFLLSSSVFKEAISATNKASTIDNVKVSDLVRTRLVIPPHREQIEIANYIFTIVERYEKLIAKAESVIGLMKERRTALISAAVTGKIDVRNWQAPATTNNNKEVAA